MAVRGALPASRRARWRAASLVAALAILGAGLAAFALAARSSHPARAMAPCDQRAMTTEEQDFFDTLQTWRETYVVGYGNPDLTLSATLNATALGYAQFLADTPGSAGVTAGITGRHSLDGAPDPYPWEARAEQCGYPAALAIGSEALGVSNTGDLTPAQAIVEMNKQRLDEGNAGIRVPDQFQQGVDLAYIRCAGVAKATSADGTKVAWVVLLMGGDTGVCPQAVTGPAPSPTPTATFTPSPTSNATSTATATATATATPTLTPTPSPTPTPVPSADFGMSLQLVAGGWSLVTLPAGALGDILDTANGCYVAVYQLSGDTWLHYAPGLPAYADTLVTSPGGAFWILGSDEDCGTIAY